MCTHPIATMNIYSSILVSESRMAKQQHTFPFLGFYTESHQTVMNDINMMKNSNQ